MKTPNARRQPAHARRHILAPRQWDRTWWAWYRATCESSRFCGDVDFALERGWDERHHRHTNVRQRRAICRRQNAAARALAGWTFSHGLVCGGEVVTVGTVTVCIRCLAFP